MYFMTISYLNQSSDFQSNYRTLASGRTEEEMKKSYPVQYKVNEKIRKATSRATQSLQRWSESTPGNFVWIKHQINKIPKIKKVKSVLNFFRIGEKKINSVLNFFGVSDNKLAPRKSAEKRYQFKDISDGEKAKIEKKAKFLTTLSKVSFIVGSILLGIGILIPFVSTIFLLAVPLTAALVTIVAFTAIGMLGAVAITVNPLLKKMKLIRENRLHGDPDFKPFLNRYLQTPKPVGAGYNLNEKDIMNGKLHKIYQEWQQDMKSIFSKKMIGKIEGEKKNKIKNETK